MKLERTVVENSITSTVHDQFIANFLDKNIGRTNESTSKLFLLWFKKSFKHREQKEDKSDISNFGALNQMEL